MAQVMTMGVSPMSRTRVLVAGLVMAGLAGGFGVAAATTASAAGADASTVSTESGFVLVRPPFIINPPFEPIRPIPGPIVTLPVEPPTPVKTAPVLPTVHPTLPTVGPVALDAAVAQPAAATPTIAPQPLRSAGSAISANLQLPACGVCWFPLI